MSTAVDASETIAGKPQASDVNQRCPDQAQAGIREGSEDMKGGSKEVDAGSKDPADLAGLKTAYDARCVDDAGPKALRTARRIRSEPAFSARIPGVGQRPNFNQTS